MEAVYWNSMCGNSSPFWDYQAVWNTTQPDFPVCFQKTVLGWTPCAVLLILAPFELSAINNSLFRHIPWTILNITKLVLCVLLSLLNVINLFSHTTFSHGTESAHLSDIITPVFQAMGIMISAAFLWSEKKHGMSSSATLLTFWFLQLICSATSFRSLILRMSSEDSFSDVNEFIFQAINFPLIGAQFILMLFKDAKPQYCKIAERKMTDICPEETASFLSRLLFTWYDGLALRGYRQALQTQHLYSPTYNMTSNVVINRFDRVLNNILNPSHNIPLQMRYKSNIEAVYSTGAWNLPENKPFLLKALLRTFGLKYLLVVFLRIVGDGFAFIGPLVLNQVIAYTSSDAPLWQGLLYAVLLALCTFMEAIFLIHAFQNCSKLGLQVRSSLMSFIYQKTLKLSVKARSKSTVGQIVNHMAVDVHKISMFVEMSVLGITVPIQIVIALVELWMFLGPSSLFTLAVILVIQILTTFLVRESRKAQVIFMKLKDKRIKMMSEILNGIKLLKLFAWEIPYMSYVTEFRQKELSVLRKIGYLGATMTIFWGSSTILISLGVFAVFVLSDPNNILDASTAFVSLTIFNLIRRPMMMLPNLISSFIEASVSLNRLNTFSWNDEINPEGITPIIGGNSAVLIEDAQFSWGDDAAPTLTNINLNVKEGSLVAVVGPVGAGKSSLISALLGEMIKLRGKVCCRENIAYSPQIPWIQNSTLKNNILFGKPFVNSKYQKILEACALLPDLEILPAGDDTEIGEKGINLSGGQKQRVSLARALYSEATVYFFDDPLSAVDAHVGKHIFDNVLGPSGLLRKHTRLLVTHSLTYVPQSDLVVVMNNGSISEIGTYDELVQKQGPFSELVATYINNGNSEDKDDDSDAVTKPDRQISLISSGTDKDDKKKLSADTSGKGKLIMAEGVETGKVKRKIYFIYIKELGIMAMGMLLFFVLSSVSNAGTNVWLSEWSDDPVNPDGTQDTQLRNVRLGVYGVLGFAFGLFLFLGTICLVRGLTRASGALHSKMLNSVLRAPQSFFDTTPGGRILNRFSSDIDTIDLPLPNNLRMVLTFFLQLLVGVLLIVVEMPWFSVVVIPVTVLFYFIQMFYMESGRQIRRLDSATKSPIYASFSECVSGAPTIRAFKLESFFFKNLTEKIDENIKCGYLSLISQRWLSLRMEFLGSVLLFSAAMFAVIQKGTFTPGTVGLVVNYTIMITANLKMLFNNVSLLETNIVAVERVVNYTTEIPQEAEWTKLNSKPLDFWPKKGNISFQEYQTKYRPELDPVLKGITCDVKDGEKVGVVGRTGAGKSSLTLALFRILESISGRIIVDGMDIATLGLHDLRSRLTIIPQDPVLFSGTLRRNLDPFDKHDDNELWTALELSHLKMFASTLPNGLLHEITEGGENLSVGQRQLVCLARALLRRSKILILDEATAAVDLETDDLIQSTVRQEFADCTIITIAHRLNTIMDADRIIVLDDGVIREMDSPKTLLEDKDSVFYGMAKTAGLI